MNIQELQAAVKSYLESLKYATPAGHLELYTAADHAIARFAPATYAIFQNGEMTAGRPVTDLDDFKAFLNDFLESKNSD